ncbi:unnamed protein product [Heterobilharzia americana]|nr:unnamed protein product [Heterobilharzia americana]
MHLHEFVAYPELLTLPIDQLSICILKGLSTAHSLVQYTLPVPKELYNLKTSQLTHQIHNDNNDTNNMDDDDNSIRSQEVAENDGQTSLPSSSPSAEQDVVETRFLITSRGVYNRINALMQIRREKMVVMPKRVNWSLASSTGHRDLSIHQKFLDCNNLMKLSQHFDNTNLLTSSTSKELIDNEDIYTNGSTNVGNSSDNINESMNNHRGVTNSCNGYLRDWVGLKISDPNADCDRPHYHQHYRYKYFEQNDLILNKVSGSSIYTPTISNVKCSSGTTLNGYHHAVNSPQNNCSPRNIHIAFVRRESSECGHSIAARYLQSKYSPAKLRRSRLRGTDHLVIKFKRDSLSRNYYPSELVPNSIAQYNEQSVNDTSCNTTATTITTSTPTIMGLNDNTTTSNANTTVTTPSSPSPPSHPATTTTTANNHNGSSDKRIRCEQNTVLCILTSPLNYSSAYNPRNTCYNSNRLLSPTTLTTSSIASRVKWGANLTLQSNSTSNYHDFNETKISYPMNQYQSEMSNKELSQHIVNGFNSLPTGIRKTSPDELDRIILHPRPRIPPKRLDLANQDLELALKRSLSDCTMRSPNNSYYNSSIKKSLPYTVRLKNQRNVNRDSTNKNLAHRRKTVIRPKRRRHRPFTSRRQKSKNGNIKSQHQFNEDFFTINSVDNSFFSNYSNTISEDSEMNNPNEHSRIVNEQISRLPLPKITLAKNSDGEFNVVGNRNENIKFSDIINEERKSTTHKIVSSTSNDSENTDISDCSPNTTIISCKYLKRKAVNKERTNYPPNKRAMNTISQRIPEFVQKSDYNVYDLSMEDVQQDINSKFGLSEGIETSKSSKTEELNSSFTNDYECKFIGNNVPSLQPANIPSTSLPLLSQQTETLDLHEFNSSLVSSAAVEPVQSVVNNIPVNSFVLTTNNNTSCIHSTNSINRDLNTKYLSPLQPVTMWSRLANPLPAPDPPTKLFNTKHVPFQRYPSVGDKCRLPSMFIPINSVCGNQVTSETQITKQLPWYPIPQSTNIPLPGAVNLPSEVYFNHNVNANLVALSTNPVQYSTLCNYASLNDLNSRQFLPCCDKTQLTSQVYSSLPGVVHSSLPPALTPAQLPSFSSPYSSSASSFLFNGNQIPWSCSANQLIVNNPLNSYISKLSGNIPMGYETSLIMPRCVNPLLSNTITSHNNFLSYPFLIPNPTLTNMTQLNSPTSTPLPGSCSSSSSSSSVQSVLGTPFVPATQNCNNIGNIYNYNWIPPSY